MAQTPALYYADGMVIDYTPVAAVAAGDVVVLGTIPMVAPVAIAAGVKGTLICAGIVKVPQVADIITAGDAVYWDTNGTPVTGDALSGAASGTAGVGELSRGAQVPVLGLIARLADGSELLEFKAGYGPGTVCAHADIQGLPVGILTNNGPLDPAGSVKATHFIQACCQSGIPLLYLQNTTGYIVGTESERGGMIKHGSKMIQAVACASVPQVTVQCGASFGAGA
jgi:predicted RecA/RadA family phage recombinase